MGNNKILNNLNFIKIYFRVFIYKIFVAEKTWIIHKRDKIYEYELKTHLSARLGSRKHKKGVQNAPEHESVIRHFWSADQHFWSDERHFKSAELHSFGLWSNSLWVPKRHTIFDFIAKRRVSIRILPIVAYFLSILVSINRD